MPRPVVHLTALLSGLALAAGLAACGSEDRSGLIPPGDADALEERIDAVASALDAGECDGLGQDLSRLRGALLGLPDTLDERLRAELDRGVENIVERAPDACEEPTDTTTTETVTTETTETQTTETETLPETTTTTVPTTTTTVPPPTTTPPDTGGVEPPTTDPVPPDDGTGGITPDGEIVP